MTATRRKNEDVIELYLKYLDEEEEKDPSPEGGHARKLGDRGPKARAVLRVKDELDYVDVGGVRLVVLKWERKKLAKLNTYGMDLDRKYSEGVRLVQDSVALMLSACNDLIEGAKSLDSGARVDVQDLAYEMHGALQEEMPTDLCPYCKAAYDECEQCDGDGWFSDGVEDGIDPRLLDAEEVHIMLGPNVVKLADYRPEEEL